MLLLLLLATWCRAHSVDEEEEVAEASLDSAEVVEQKPRPAVCNITAATTK
jgi:hypothetical protein